MAQHNVNYTFEKSAYLCSYDSTSNYSSQDYLLTGNYGAYPSVEQRMAIFGYNSQSIKDILKYKKITAAVLHVYLLSSIPKPSHHWIQTNAYNLYRDWGEKTVTYANMVSQYGSMTWHNINNSVSSGWFDFILYGYDGLEKGMGFKLEVPFDTQTAQMASTRASSNKPYLTITYEDVPPETPIVNLPDGNYVDNSSIIKFEWKHNDSMGGIQKKFDLQWSSNNGGSWNTISQTTSNNYYNMPANTLPSGNILWRVRTYNVFGETGNYSPSTAFYSVGMPKNPTIQDIPGNVSRPTISWGSDDQQLYQVQILQEDNLIYDSGVQPSTSVKNHMVNKFLLDGIYTAQVRTKNRYDLWSNWTQRSFNIQTTKPVKPNIILQSNNYGVAITTDNESGTIYILYRKKHNESFYIPVFKAVDGIVKDNTLENNIDYDYFIRAVKNGAFNDSDIVRGKCLLKNYLFSSIKNMDDVVEMKYSLHKNNKDFSLDNLCSENNYTGRKYPVTEYSPFVKETYNLKFFANTFIQLQKFIDLINERTIILYRDKFTKKYGNICNIRCKQYKKGFSMEFTFNVTDHSEEIEV